MGIFFLFFMMQNVLFLCFSDVNVLSLYIYIFIHLIIYKFFFNVLRKLIIFRGYRRFVNFEEEKKK